MDRARGLKTSLLHPLVAIMRTILLLLLLGCPPALCAGGEAQPQNARETELAAVRDRLSFSLFFRGEVADALIASGVAARYVGLGGVETNSGARSIVMEWIQKNKGAAAELYLNLRSGETAPPENIREHESVWEINPNFLSLIKDLNAAAGGAGVPMEALEAAGRSLYEGPQQTGAVRAALAGDAGPGGAAFFSGYADYRLNKAGLEREVAADGVWLAAARGPDGGAPRGLERPYREALAEYGDFVVAASGVKGRGRITGAESRALESGRARVRAKIASLELSLRAADLAAIEAALRALAGTAGADTLAAAAAGLRASFEAAAGQGSVSRRYILSARAASRAFRQTLRFFRRRLAYRDTDNRDAGRRHHQLHTYERYIYNGRPDIS